jgi:hypothetical protein
VITLNRHHTTEEATMNKTFTPRCLALAGLALLGPVQAQDRALQQQIEAATEQAREAWRLSSRAELERQFAVGEAFEATFGVAGEMGPQRVVKGAPYCADAVHETVQWLADGSGGAPNRIVRQQSTRLCRDGEGRTRQEVERGKRKLVYLHDPVARESWVLDPEHKTARRIGGSRGAERMALDSSAWREYAERMREWSRQFAEQHRRAQGSGTTPPTPPAPPVPPTPPVPPAPMAAPVVITRTDEGPRTETREVRVLRVPGGATSDWVMPAPVLSRALSLAPRGAGTVTPLPPKEIEGVRANGERTSWVIEAGKVGNEKPITITREVWTAPELMLTVSSRDFDPRSGEVNYRLINVKRGEPDAALMKVPADFGQPGAKAPKAG